MTGEVQSDYQPRVVVGSVLDLGVPARIASEAGSKKLAPVIRSSRGEPAASAPTLELTQDRAGIRKPEVVPAWRYVGHVSFAGFAARLVSPGRLPNLVPAGRMRMARIVEGHQRRPLTPGVQYCARIGKRKVRHSPRR